MFKRLPQCVLCSMCVTGHFTKFSSCSVERVSYRGSLNQKQVATYAALYACANCGDYETHDKTWGEGFHFSWVGVHTQNALQKPSLEFQNFAAIFPEMGPKRKGFCNTLWKTDQHYTKIWQCVPCKAVHGVNKQVSSSCRCGDRFRGHPDWSLIFLSLFFFEFLAFSFPRNSLLFAVVFHSFPGILFRPREKA